MNVTLSGVLKDPYNNPLANATIVFETEKTSNQTLKSTNAKVNTGSDGAYSITVPYGTYTIKVKQENHNSFQTIATGIRVNESSTATTLNQLITEAVDIDDVPDLILQIVSLKQDIVDLRDENVLIRNETQQLRDEVVGIEIELQGSVDTIQTYETRLSDLENNALSIDPALSPADGEVLVYNSTLGYFESTNYVPVSSLNDLTDVDTTSISSGDFLRYDGVKFVPSKVFTEWDLKEEVTITSGVVDIDLSSPKGYVINLTEDITQMSFSNLTQDAFPVFAIVFIQDSIGGHSVNFPSNVNPPIFQPYAAADSITIMTFASFDGGITYYQSDVSGSTQSAIDIEDIAGLQTQLNSYSSDINDFDTRLSAVEGTTTQVSMSTLDDVDITGITTGQILEYDGTNFVPVDQPNIPSSFVEQFNDLSDVNVTGISSGDFIYFNGSVFTGVQVDIPNNINDLNDVVVSAPQHDQALAWNSVTQRFENRTISGSGSATNLSGLNDTNISSPQNNQLLRYDSSISRWANWTMPAYATNLNGLSDVTISSVQNNHVLKRTSTGWVNANINISDVSNLQANLNSKADTSHTHTISDIDGLLSSLSSKADATHTHSIADVTGLQTELNNKTTQSYVDQEISTVTNLLGDKADTVHSHVISDVTGLQGELDTLQTNIDGKTNVGHNHILSDITDFEVTSPDSDQVIAYDLATSTWINKNIQITDVTDLQSQLSGKTDIGHQHIIDDVIDLQTELNSKASLTHSHAISDVTGLQDALDTKADATHTHVINDIIDFDVESPLEGHILVFDTVDSKWVNSPALADKADVVTVTALADQVDALEGQGLMKLGGVPLIQGVSAQPRFYYKSNLEKKAANNDVLGIFSISERSYLQVNALTNGTNHGATAYLYDNNDVQLWTSAFITSDPLLDQKIEIIDYDISENADAYQIAVLCKYVYQGNTTFRAWYFRQKKSGTSELYSEYGVSTNQSATFNDALSVALGDNKLYVVYKNDQDESFIQRRSLDYNLSINFTDIIDYPSVPVDSAIKCDRFGKTWVQYQNQPANIFQVDFKDDGTISSVLDAFYLTNDTIDWRFIKDNFMIYITPTKVGIKKNPTYTYDQTSVDHNLTITNPKLYIDYWRKKVSIQDGVNSYDVNLDWRGYWKDNDIESGFTKLINQDNLDNQTFTIDKIDGLQTELDTLQTNVDDAVSQVDNKQDKIVNTIESTEGLWAGAVGGYVPFDININGVIVTVTQESSVNPGVDLRAEIVNAINAANIPNITAEEVSSSNLRLINSVNEEIVITASGNDANGNPVVGTSSVTGWPVGVKEPNFNNNMIRQEDVYGLTSILNNIRVETLTEVVSLADTEVVVTLSSITIGDTPMVFVDGSPITDFTVDSDTQITLGSGYSAGSKIVTVVQNNVRFD